MFKKLKLNTEHSFTKWRTAFHTLPSEYSVLKLFASSKEHININAFDL